MATIVLSAVGAAAGASIGGGVLGLSSVLIGRALGATIGQSIDRRIFGQRLLGGSEVVEQGQVDRFRLTGASEGGQIPETYGRMRVPGQVIWASRFLENVEQDQVSTGGKGGGGGGTTTVKTYTYSVSLAIALGAGEISRVGRIWADGNEVAPSDLNVRVYSGSQLQLPDPKIEAIEGAGNVPAFRGTAYVVIEDLELAPYGNRVPQFNFEVVRPEQGQASSDTDLSRAIRAVALVPGTGEYSLATTPVHVSKGPGQNTSVNVNSPTGLTDCAVSVETMKAELPNHRATSLVVSWFATDLRCGEASVTPRVDQDLYDGVEMPWRVSGLSRSEAGVVPHLDSRPVYGGTPADGSVIEAIKALREDGRSAMFYPFLLMEQMAGNGLPDPWNGEDEQRALPWRGRITLSAAPGQPGSPDGTAAAAAEVASFFGDAAPGDFSISGGTVFYSGPPERSYRRFILHYAHLCVAAGGVDAFCIGSEMRSLTQIRGQSASFPAVAALRSLAADVRSVLGPNTKIGYAADWSEYFGYQPQDGSGDVYFHLDPLWADPNIDFVGIDNYVPLSDWRDGEDHADIGWGAPHNLQYLRANIEGGEGYDWYYASEDDSQTQTRTPITDGAYGEPWIYRFKDLRSWWSSLHFNRLGGVRSPVASPWNPQSKPIWFTELGCPAVDKGANAPYKFYDPKSSESSLPHYSNGNRDDAIQLQFLIAHLGYWSEDQNNPVSGVYGGRMIDLDRIFIWSWDARPFPFFPNNLDVWSDGGNYGRGHWLNGRTSSRALASVVAEICAASGITDIDTSELYGVVRGFSNDGTETGREALQPLMLAYGFDVIERQGQLVFRTRTARPTGRVGTDDLVETSEVAGTIERTRAPEAETVGRVRIGAIEAEGSYQARSGEAIFPDETVTTVTSTDLPLLLTQAELRAISERWLAEARVARDSVRFSLPPSRTTLSVGDVVTINEDGGDVRYRIDRIEQSGLQIASAVRVDADIYAPSPDLEAVGPHMGAFVAPVPVYPVFLDLPLLRGDEVAHAPHIAVAASPWPGSAAVYKSSDGESFGLDTSVSGPTAIGITETALDWAAPSRWDRGPALLVKLVNGVFDSVSENELLNGANGVAIGSGVDDHWEVFQFRDAVLVGTNTYALSMRLRGQAGTDGVMPPSWPPGSLVVPLGGSVVQIGLEAAERGLERTYRIGPGNRPVSDSTYVEQTHAFSGIGLRPYAPVHLKARTDGAGDTVLRWVRRTRIDGDGWLGLDVPLGEERERYVLRLLVGTVLVRAVTTEAPQWTYGAAEKAADGVSGPVDVEIAQLSDRFGPGPLGRITFNV
ncbi:MAG: glycoside hydrolase/phage tail family protein [Pseudomonadota bacterium]